MGEIHELFVLALSLVWFAGATPESFQEKTTENIKRDCDFFKNPEGRKLTN